MDPFTSGTLALMLTTVVGSLTPPGPPAPPPARVRALVQQLDDDRYAVRQDADQALRQLGVAALPLLRKELAGQPPLEARRRLTAIVDDLSRIHWRQDFDGALRQARQTGKPLLVFSASGLPSAPLSIESAAMQQRTFADLALITFINENFVAVWHDPMPGELHARRSQTPQFTLAQVNDYKEGTGHETHLFFCLPDGCVVQHFEGFHGASGLLKEATRIRSLPKGFRPTPPTAPVATAAAAAIKQTIADGTTSTILLNEAVPGRINGPLSNPIGRHVWDVTVELEQTMRKWLRIGC